MLSFLHYLRFILHKSIWDTEHLCFFLIYIKISVNIHMPTHQILHVPVQCVPHFRKHHLVLSTVESSSFAKSIKHHLLPTSVEKTVVAAVLQDKSTSHPKYLGIVSTLESNQKYKKKNVFNRGFYSSTAREHLKDWSTSQLGKSWWGNGSTALFQYCPLMRMPNWSSEIETMIGQEFQQHFLDPSNWKKSEIFSSIWRVKSLLLLVLHLEDG